MRNSSSSKDDFRSAFMTRFPAGEEAPNSFAKKMHLDSRNTKRLRQVVFLLCGCRLATGPFRDCSCDANIITEAKWYCVHYPQGCEPDREREPQQSSANSPSVCASKDTVAGTSIRTPTNAGGLSWTMLFRATQ